jgi:hypothetical protein
MDSDPSLARALDSLEVELRQIAGVTAVAVIPSEEGLHLVVLVRPSSSAAEVQRRAEELTSTMMLTPVRVEVNALQRARSGVERVRLLSVTAVGETAKLEVELFHRGARGRGAANGRGPQEAVLATLEALRGLGARIPFLPAAVARVAGEPGGGVFVVLMPDGEGPTRLGIARGRDDEESAARATLSALNRYLSEAGAFG